jgi:6-phosphogluconate dehydrogenase
MGGPMVRRLLNDGHEVIAFDPAASALKAAEENGAVATHRLEDLVDALPSPRLTWIMVPSGDPTEETITRLSTLMDRGDVLIDGGNSFYKDSMRRAEDQEGKGVTLLDAGTSGGIWGLEIGYCLMIGGSEDGFRTAEPIFASLAPENGYAHVGPSGAGHFVKMIHNGIEYALLQGYAEGLELMAAKTEFQLDLAQISHLWNQGSVIRSWLLELAERALAKDSRLSAVAGYVEDSGEGRWTVAEAIERNVPAPVITHALFERFHSRQKESFAAKVIAALRNEFGGHDIKNK